MKTRYIGSCLVLLLMAGIQDVYAKKKEELTPYEKAVGVFVPGQDNPYAAIRIPCIVNAGGMLIAVAEGRHSAADQANNDMIVSVSKNGGKKWSKVEVAAKADHGATLNNPCLIYDAEKKQTMLFYQRYPAGVKEQGPNPPEVGWEDPEKTLRNFVVFTKNGKTWTKPVEVTKETRHEDCSMTCSGPNPGVQLTQGPHKGRLVVAFNEAVKFGNWHVTAAYSDDHGKTWKIGEKSESGKGINEVSSAELPGGKVLVVSRSYGGGDTRRVAVSDDGGETWGPVGANEDLPSYNCQNGLTRYSFEEEAKYGGKSRLIFSASSSGRINGFIKMSYDDGKTWPVQKEIGPGVFAYSALCTVKPGRVGLLFECENHTIKFTSFSIKWLTDGEDTGIGKEEK